MGDLRPAPPQGYALGVDEVHLWRIERRSAARMFEGFFDLITEDEKGRAARFRSAADRDRFVIGRAMTRLLLGALLGTAPATLSIRQDAHGKPFVEHDGAAPGPTFNVSHSGEHVLLALARGRPVGVDVQEIRGDTDVAAIAQSFFSAQEQTELAALPADQRLAASFRCWCRKEAFVKAIGLGLSYPFTDFDVSVAAHPQTVLLRAGPDVTTVEGWFIRDLELDEAHMAALAAKGGDASVSTWRLTYDGRVEMGA